MQQVRLLLVSFSCLVFSACTSTAVSHQELCIAEGPREGAKAILILNDDDFIASIVGDEQHAYSSLSGVNFLNFYNALQSLKRGWRKPSTNSWSSSAISIDIFNGNSRCNIGLDGNQLYIERNTIPEFAVRSLDAAEKQTITAALEAASIEKSP